MTEFPEWPAFRAAVADRDPAAGTACAAWTTRELVAHQAGNAVELARVLVAHLDGRDVPATRGFEEREAPFRSLRWPALLEALDAAVADLAEVVGRGRDDPESLVPWTGRHMRVRWFGEHLRSELVLHRRDLVGDDAVGDALLAEPWMTEHSVEAVGAPLLRAGLERLGNTPVTARLRAPGRPDVVVRTAPTPGLALEPVDGAADLVADPAARALLLWGRAPHDPSRMTSDAGPARLGRLRTLLAGY